ncbi:MAG: argininosuccinate lyase [Rhizobiales bacterium]|nr:argininosuccinate lyase [Hyphomicrobiales bacterium]NRB14923.1 argininosuccinate lyase [Hyphomicrobiales bacterium]
MIDNVKTDQTVFPDPAYKDTVLAPLFEGAKTHFVAAVRSINQAHLVMLHETKIITTNQAKTIAEALIDIDQNLDISQLEYTGEYEDYFFLVEAELIKRVGVDVAGVLHTARSRNDMDHTVFKTVLTTRLDELLELMHSLADAMIITADREKATLIVAYTHGQPAQPSTFGHYLAAAIEVLLRDIERLHAARTGLEKCPMGAAAITTSGFPIDRHRMAELLGFKAPLQNSYSCIAAVDYVTSLYSSMKLTFLHLGRLVQDFQFWSSFEVAQLYVPNSFVQISSIMPQKRNPVPIEHLRLLSSITVGRCDTMVNIMHNTPFTDMNDSEGEVQQAGYGAFETGGRVLKLLAAFIPALSINAEAVRANTDKSCITVTELADALVRGEGLSFRQAHEIAALTAQAVIAAKQPLGLGYAAFVEAFKTEVGQAPKLTQSAYEITVSAENFIAVRARFGGPAAAPMANALNGYREELAKWQQQATGNLNFKNESENNRYALFLNLKNEQGNL